jgi:hypothetical protein
MKPGPLAPILASLSQAWRTQAAELRGWGAPGNAETLERAARELEAALDAEAGELLPLERAAEVSGYNADSLRRMAREKKLPVQHKGRRLYFRAGDLPRKPPEPASTIDGPQLVGYDPLADARMVARERQRGE